MNCNKYKTRIKEEHTKSEKTTIKRLSLEHKLNMKRGRKLRKIMEWDSNTEHKGQ
jgi:hypothetical protein